MLKEKKDKTMQIRISNDDYKLFKIASYTIGQKPSQMVRMFIDTTVNALRLKVNRGELKIEDYESIINDKL